MGAETGYNVQGCESGSRTVLNLFSKGLDSCLKGKILGECLVLTKDEYLYLITEISQRIRKRQESWGGNLRTAMDAVPPQALLVAAVFFVRYDYSYEQDGFWKPFFEALDVEYSQANWKTLVDHFERAFRQLELYRPNGGYRHVSPLIYHSILPNDGIRSFAEIIAKQEPHWNYWASATTEVVVDFLISQQTSISMKRLLEHDGKLVADLFVDVCDYLDTGVWGTNAVSGLDVRAIASEVRECQEARRRCFYEPVQRTRRDHAYIPRPSWVWQRANSRIGLMISPLHLAGESGQDVSAKLQVGTHEFPLQVDNQSLRTTPFFIDSWCLGMNSGTTVLKLICNGQECAKQSVTNLDLSSPIVELNGVLVNIRGEQEVPHKAWWMLPQDTSFGDDIVSDASEITPYPLSRWQVFLLVAQSDNWTFQRNGIQSQTYMCNIERRLSWLLRTNTNSVGIEANAGQGPVLTDWPEIELIGYSPENNYVCEVRNLSTEEQKTYNLSEIVDHGVDGTYLLSHFSLCSEFTCKVGVFRIKLKTSSFRSVTTAPAITYCFVPLCSLQVPKVVKPQDKCLEVRASLGVLIDSDKVKAVGAEQFDIDQRQMTIRWPAGTKASFVLNTPLPLRLQLSVPRITWGVNGVQASGDEILPASAVKDTSQSLVLTTDPQQSATLVVGDCVLERPEGVSRWEVPLTAFYEAVEKASSLAVSVQLNHAGGVWEVLRFRRKLVVTCVLYEQLGASLIVKAKLSADTSGHLYAIAACVGGNTKATRQSVELDPTGDIGAVINTGGTQSGKWRVVFRLCTDINPSHGELLLGSDGHVALLEVEVADETTIAPASLRESDVIDDLLECADWQLPLDLFVPNIRWENKDALRNQLIENLIIRSGQDGRKAMEHLAAEGINFASFPVAQNKSSEKVIYPEDLANLWQPLAVPICTGFTGEWTEGVANILGRSREHPLFLPHGTIVQYDNKQYTVASGHCFDTFDGVTYDRFDLCSYGSIANTHCLLFRNSDHVASLHTIDNLLVDDDNNMKPLRRLRIDSDSMPVILDKSWSDGLKLIYRKCNEPKFLSTTFSFVNDRQPAYRPEFLVKGYWQWTMNAAHSSDFSKYWEETRHESVVYSWLREHLGEKQEVQLQKILFDEELTKPCQGILIKMTHQIEHLFPYYDDAGAYAYPGFVYALAVYNRLAARYPNKIAAIQPKSGGREWLCKHSAVAFRDARLMFNYWLILVESILNWWNQEERSDRQA